MEKVKVILFGMTGFGNNALNVLIKKPYIELIGVLAPKKQESPYPYYKCEKLHDVLIKNGIALYEGLNLKDKNNILLIESLSPDLIVVGNFNQIIPMDIISIPKLGVINVHPSLLPKYRGATPTVWALMNNEEETGVTVHFIENEKVDSGRIVLQAKLKIKPLDTDGSLRFRLAELSEKVLSEAIDLIMTKDKKTFPQQDESRATYYPKRALKDAEINMDREHIQRCYGIRPEAQEFPMMCVLSFVYVCNARCPNCPYTNSEIRSDYKDRPFMNEDTFKIIADQCGEYDAYIRISGGGEPMLHPKAVELMEYAKRVGAKVGLITNGSMFTEGSIRRLLEAQVDMIEFSVDAADPDTYAKVRKGLNWETLSDNVKRMVELRNKLKSKTKIIASGVNQIGVDIDKVATFWSQIVDEFQKRKYLTWGINEDCSADTVPYLPSEDKIPCPFLFERLNIDSRGNVMVCGYDIAANTNLGNIHEKSIKEIWHGEEFEYYRRRHLERKGDEIPLCKNCTDWKYRSWKHNYWKIVDKAEKSRVKKLLETEGTITE